MTSYRADQVGEQVREEIMSIIRRELKDPRIGFVSITSVRMSPDLRQARVRVSVLGNPEEQKASIAGLNSAKGLIRHELGRRLQNLKFSPELRFELDPSIEYSVHISELLKEVLPRGDRGRAGGGAIANAKSKTRPLYDEIKELIDANQEILIFGHKDAGRRHAGLQPCLRRGAAHRGQGRVGADPAAAARRCTLSAGCDEIIGRSRRTGRPAAGLLLRLRQPRALRERASRTIAAHATIVNVDHHPSNSRFGDVNVIDPDASAVGQMVMEMLDHFGYPITPTIAIEPVRRAAHGHRRLPPREHDAQGPRGRRPAGAPRRRPRHIATMVYKMRPRDHAQAERARARDDAGRARRAGWPGRG